MEEKHFETSSLDLEWNNDIRKMCSLYRKKEPLISKVVMDEAVSKASESFDFNFDGNSKFYPFELPKIFEKLNFQILVITGSSGSGKSVFSRYFGKEEKIEWDLSKAIISNFDSWQDGVERLSATGLSSIPSWCRPYNVLSVGEQFRADLARRLKSNCVIDEFTSTVNRETALSCSSSISKYIRKNNLQRCVFVSCHKDFIDVLCPDYVIDLDDMCMYDTRGLLRRRFKLSIYEAKNKAEMWQIFKHHHYLTTDLNISARMFIGYFENTPVACCSVISQPGIPGCKGGYGWRIHRLVVLPDYQGLGIATKMLEYICDMWKYYDRIIYLRTSHIKLINYMKNSSKWKGNGILEHSHQQTGILHHYKANTKRLSTSFKYIANCSHNPEYDYSKISFITSPEWDVNQDSTTKYNEINLW